VNDDDIRFREFVRTVGRGEKRAKPLNFEDASIAMGLILDGRADPRQASAFLLACRMKGEDPIEVAGFTQALQQRCQLIALSVEQRQAAVCVGHPYDGREDTFIMGAGAALVAAAGGATVVLHGAPKVPAKHAPTIAEVFAALKIPAYLPSQAAAEFLERHGFVHADTRAFLPPWTRSSTCANGSDCGCHFPLWKSCSIPWAVATWSSASRTARISPRSPALCSG